MVRLQSIQGLLPINRRHDRVALAAKCVGHQVHVTHIIINE